MRPVHTYGHCNRSLISRRTNMIPIRKTLFAAFASVILAAASSTQAQMMPPAAQYEGRWEFQPNGDVKVTRTFKLPMQMYTMWKSKDVHMLEARNFAGERSTVEVAAKKADWDDLNQTLTMTMTVLGLCQNKGDHWEGKMLPNIEFSNLDETRKIAYFHFSVDGDMGRIQGQDVVVFPPACTRPTWDSARKVVTYITPPTLVARTAAVSSESVRWWVLAAICIVGGVALFLASLLVKPAKKLDPGAQVSV